MTRNPEAVKNYPRSVRAVQCIEVNTCDIVVQKIVALIQCIMNPDAPDHFGIALAKLESAKKFGGKTRAARQLGHAF